MGIAAITLQTVILLVVYAVVRPSSGSWLNTIVGSVGLGFMVVMLIYSIARRSKTLRRVAKLSVWLEFHIFCGFEGVILVVIHSLPMLFDPHVPPPLNPGLWSLAFVLIVFFSGLFGRYLFIWVPQTLDGRLKFVPASQRNRVTAVFRWWIVIHRFIAATMYILAAAHVALGLMFSPRLGVLLP